MPPPALIADIGGGTYPAVINILLALRERDRTGKGCKLDIAMGDNLFTFMYWAMGNGEIAGDWPTPGGELVTGGSPRYNIYRTRDNKFVAAAPLEQKFWKNFCALIELPADMRDDRRCRENQTSSRRKNRGKNRATNGAYCLRARMFAATSWRRSAMRCAMPISFPAACLPRNSLRMESR